MGGRGRRRQRAAAGGRLNEQGGIAAQPPGWPLRRCPLAMAWAGNRATQHGDDDDESSRSQVNAYSPRYGPAGAAYGDFSLLPPPPSCTIGILLRALALGGGFGAKRRRRFDLPGRLSPVKCNCPGTPWVKRA